MKSVRFGNRGALKIVEPSVLSTLRSGIEEQIGYQINDKRYSLLNKKNLPKLTKKPYLVGINTLGQRFLLLLTTMNNKRYCIFINRKKEMMIVVRFRFQSDLFSGDSAEATFPGTLFEGELLKVKNSWYYIISDILIDRGNKLSDTPFEERLSRLEEIVNKCHVPDSKQDPCSLSVKKYFAYQHIESIIKDYVPTLQYKEFVTGLSFKNTSKSIIYILPECRATKSTVATKTTGGATVAKKITVPKSAIKKNKNGHFKLVETDMPDVFELYNANAERIGYAAVPDLECSTLINDLLEEAEEKGEDLYVMCTYSKKFSKWVPTKRADPF